MKKLISIILAIMLVSALAVTSFAAPTVDFVFNADGYTYVFGSVEDTITDMGLKITNKNGVREYAEFSAITPSEINDVNNSGKFGFAIEANGMLNDSFTVKPYCETANGTVEGSSYVVNPTATTKSAVAEGYAVGIYSLGIKLTDGTINSTDPNKSDGSVGYADVYEYNAGNVHQEDGKGRIGLIRYDISEVDENASDIYVTIGYNGANSSTHYQTAYMNGSAKIGVYLVDDLKVNWGDLYKNGTVTASKDLFTAAPSNVHTFQSKYEKICEVQCGTDDVEYYEDGTSAVTKGAKLKADVTEVVKAALAEGKSYIDLAWSITEPQEAALTVCFRGVDYTYSNVNYNVDGCKPRVEWE